MPIAPPLNVLIHSIYQGVLEEAPWTSFLNRLNTLLDADLAIVMIVPGHQQGNKVLFNQVTNPLSSSTALSDSWIAQDPFQQIADDTPLRLTQLGPLQRRVHNHWADEPDNPHSIHHLLALNVSTGSRSELLLKLRIGRTGHKPDFSEQHTTLLVDMVEHLKLALRLFDQNAIQRIERNAFADAINQFMLGTLILDRSGTIVASNRVARDSIEQYPTLSIQKGSLVIGDTKANRQLYQALSDIEQNDCSDDAIGKTITIPLANGLTLGLMIRPIRPEDALAYPVHAHAVVFISNSQGVKKISAATLKELFGLTDSEAKVAAYLANGNTLNEAAECLSVSINTAKTHARNIYEKTGVNKQTKFIQLVSNSVARVS